MEDTMSNDSKIKVAGAVAAGAKWSLLTLTFVTFVLSMWVSQAESQEKYPTRAIEIIVPFSPGGSTDLMARIIAPFMSKKWGVPVNVVNKPGGNTVPACLEVYNARPDGYTMLMDGTPSATLVVAAVKNLPFKIMDRTFIAMIDTCPMLIMVSPNSPFKSLKDLEAEAKRDPEKLTWTSLGGAGNQDLAVRQFLKAIGVDVTKTKPVMSKGGTEPITLTAGGHVKIGSSTVATALPAIGGGMIRPIVVTSKTRMSQLPDVPTTAELGYPTVTSQNWHGISGPPNLPVSIVNIWNKALEEVVQDADAISKMNNIGAISFYHNARETREMVQKEIEEVRELWGLN
jgi:tripartite-type tricarboxylate transporter receptor subunit TctC